MATNVAETSITVDDVTHVIDTGFVKELHYDLAANTSILQEVFISRASGKQRAGRAGRVQAGHCWKLYSKEYYLSSNISDHASPEIQRLPLEDVVLQVILLKLGLPQVFLRECLEAPSLERIKASVDCLFKIKAILPYDNYPLTALGYHLAKMPVDVRLGKILVYASILQCIEPALTIVASLGSKSPFSCPPYHQEEARGAHLRLIKCNVSGSSTDASINTFSDHIAIVNAYNKWHKCYVEKG